jgi:hypothetical protein
MKQLTFFVFLITATISGLAQPIKSGPNIILNVQKVRFITSDTLYDFTRFIEPEGKYYFQEGIDDSLLVAGPSSRSVARYKDIYMKDTLIRYKVEYRPIHETDTIINTLASLNNKDLCSENKVYDNLNFSYVLHQLGETNLEGSKLKTVRFLYSCQDEIMCTEYNLIKLIFYKDSVMLHKIVGSSTDYRGIVMVDHKMAQVKKEDIRKITKIFSSINDLDNVYCMVLEQMFLVELSDQSL